ncbi:MAG: YhjD/YihY/BrkB family envelope integrity protein [Actinomycetota bacterium]
MSEESRPQAPPAHADEPTRSRSIRERSEELRARADETRRTLEEQAEDLRKRHASVRLAFQAYDQDRRHAGSLLAGGLAYRLFIWLVPAALVTVSVLGLIADLSSRDPAELAEDAGLAAALAATIARAVEETGSASIILLLLGLWALMWAGKSVVKALRLLSGVAWQIRPEHLTHSLRVSVAFSGLTLALVALPAALGPLYSGPFIADLLVWIVTPILLAPAFALGFAWLPHPEGLRWTAFLPGAALLALGLQLMRIATSVYFVGRLERVNDLYGAIGLATVLMVWLFLIGRLVVAAMALNAERWRAATGTQGQDA